MKRIFALLLIVSMLAVGCSSTQTGSKRQSQEHMTLATNWVQTSAEWKALSLQSYQWATLRMKEALKKMPKAKKAAVVVDIDETILDNSAFQARSISDGTNYPVGWNEWVEEAKAPFIPGAKEFLATAKSLGVRVFYITNRKTKEGPATLKNLQSLGVSVSNEDLLPKEKESSKESRRQEVLKNYELLLLVGDNLADFHSAFDGASMSARDQAVEKFASEWGKKWVVLPNPMYGDWESAIYEFNFGLDHDQKGALRHKNLRTLR